MSKRDKNATGDESAKPVENPENPPLSLEMPSLEAVLASVAGDVVEPSPQADIGGLSGGRPDSPPMSSSATVGHDAASSPMTEKRGRGRPRKDGSQPKLSESGSRPKLNGLGGGSIPAVDQSLAAIEPCAQLCTMMVNMSGMALGGEKAAMLENEAVLAKGGFMAYFKAKGVENVPAWIILAGSLSPYYLRIIATTPAKNTISSACGRMWFGIKDFVKRRRNARFNSRNDIKRENDSSASTSEKSE